jgi:hypothetical protein
MEQPPVSVGYSPAVKFIPLVPALAAAALSLWCPASTLGAQTGERSVLRQLYGDLAFEVRTKGQGSVMVGVADARTSLVFTLLSIDLRRWSDSATRMLAARPPRRGQTAKWEAVLTGPGVTAGSLSLARTIAPGDTTIILLVTDTAFRGMRTALSMEEARALAVAMKRAANASLPTRPAPMPKARPPAATPPPKKPPPPESR